MAGRDLTRILVLAAAASWGAGALPRAPDAIADRSPRESLTGLPLRTAAREAPDGGGTASVDPLVPCDLQLRHQAWPLAGDPPEGRALFAGWVSGRYVHVEEDAEPGQVVARLYDASTQSWSTARFDARRRDAHGQGPTSADRGPAYTPGDFAATEEHVVLAPRQGDPALHAGAVLDVARAHWRALSREEAPWLDSPSMIRSSRSRLLFWPRPATPSTAAGSKILLFAPARRAWMEIPPPPLDMHREQPVIAFDSTHLIVQGGTQKRHFAPPVALGDGALFDFDKRTWTPITPAPAVGAASARLYPDHLLLVRGGGPPGAPLRGEHPAPGVLVYDLGQDAWTASESPPGDPQQQRVECPDCRLQVAAGALTLLGQGLVYDGERRVLRATVPTGMPDRWPASGNGLRGYVLDRHRLLALSTGSAAAARDALVLDTRTLRWCSATMPEEVVEWLPGARISAREGILYLWLDVREVVDMDARRCPPGAPCKAPARRLRTRPALAAQVSFGARSAAPGAIPNTLFSWQNYPSTRADLR